VAGWFKEFDMPKGIREPYQELEGGKGFGGMGGGGGGGGGRTMAERIAERRAAESKALDTDFKRAMGTVAGTGLAAATADYVGDKMQENKKKEAVAREAAAELKRESQRGMKKGGVTRADGCITKGHTRGKMV
jgi:hypothetical protein